MYNFQIYIMKYNAFFYTILFLIKQYLSYLVYPLKVIDESDKIENLLSFNSTFTTLEGGDPLQRVNFYFSLNHSKIYISDLGCYPSNLWNLRNSNSYIIIGEVEKNDQTNISKILMMDKIYFYDNIDLSKKLEIQSFPFFYYTDLSKQNFNVCGSIGLLMTDVKNPEEFDEYLKLIGSQTHHFSFFNYNGQDYIVNSIFLHIEFKDIFKNVKNISWVNPILGNDVSNWEIPIKDIYYNNIHIKNTVLELNPLFELIIGDNDYKANIENDFFKSYFKEEICSVKEKKEYKIFECDANKFNNKDIKQFPTLHMFNIEINYIFEMNGEDLFIKINDKLYFKIVFPILDLLPKRWILGKIFLRKYPTIFSSTNKLIGFYLENEDNLPEEDKEKKGDKASQIENDESIFSNTFFICLIIVIILGLFFAGVYFWKKILLSKRHKKNQLIDDYYQYDSDNIKKNKKKGIKDNAENNSIEMDNK